MVTKLRLPDVSEGDVTLMRKDVLAQTLFDFDVLIAQSGTVRGDEIYYTFGFGRDEWSREYNQIRVYDLRTGPINRRIDLATEISEELESCDFYEGKLYVMTQLGNLYEISI